MSNRHQVDYIKPFTQNIKIHIAAHGRRLRSNLGKVNIRHEVHHLRHALQKNTCHLDCPGLCHPTLSIIFWFPEY